MYRGFEPAVEAVGVQVDLTIRNRDQVGGNIGGDISALGLHDGQCSERAFTRFLAETGSALQQAGVQIEDISGISLTARRPSQQQAKFSIGIGVFAQVIVHDQHVMALVHEKLGHGAAGIGSQVAQGRCVV